MASYILDATGLSVTRTFTWPDATGTIALTTGSSSIVTVGTITTGVWHGTKIGLAYGGTNADLSGTGGAHQFLRQNSSGATIDVVQPALADLSDAATIALLASPTFTGTPAAPTATAGDASTQLATTAFVNLNSSNTLTVFDTISTGDTISPVANAYQRNLLAFDPGGSILALTIAMPDGQFDGQDYQLSFSSIVTTLTLTGTFVGAASMANPTTATATSNFGFTWDVVTATPAWRRYR